MRAWSELSRPERMAVLGGGLALLSAAGLGLFASRRYRFVQQVDHELTPVEQEDLRRSMVCARDGLIRSAVESAAAASGQSQSPDVMEELVRRMYRHVGTPAPTFPCVVRNV